MSMLAGDSVRMAETKDLFAGHLRSMREAADAFFEQIEGLERVCEGDARGALLAGLRDDYAELEGLIEFISTVEQSLSRAELGYERCEAAVEGVVDSLKVR